jgi:hypothetical protein
MLHTHLLLLLLFLEEQAEKSESLKNWSFRCGKQWTNMYFDFLSLQMIILIIGVHVTETGTRDISIVCKLIVKLCVRMRHAYDVRLILDHGRLQSALCEDLAPCSYITKYRLHYYPAGYVKLCLL